MIKAKSLFEFVDSVGDLSLITLIFLVINLFLNKMVGISFARIILLLFSIVILTSFIKNLIKDNENNYKDG